MRTLSASKEAQWRRGTRSTHLRVLVGGVEITDLESMDWVESAQITEDINTPVSVAELTLTREFSQLSLSPFMSLSKLNTPAVVIAVAKSLTIEVAIMPIDTAPIESDYLLKFSGAIDSVDWAKNPISIKARDQGGALEDTLIETQQIYSSVITPDDIETVIQDILDDHAIGSVTLFSENGTGGTPWNPGDSPGFKIKRYYQSKQSVFEACRTLAMMIGWECRYRFNADTAAYQPTLYEPNRANITPDFTFSNRNEYREFTALTESRIDVRNRVKVSYFDSGHGNMVPSGPGNINFNIASNDTITRTDGGSWSADGFVPDLLFEVVGTADNDGFYTVASVGPATTLTLDGTGHFVSETIAIANVAISSGFRTVVVRNDVPSQTKYGLRTMELTEASSSVIDTAGEAGDMADAAISDLSEPTALAGISCNAFPWVELGDLWQFNANGVHFDTAQKLAPYQLTHNFQSGGDTVTTASLRGKITGGQRQWLEAEGARGAAPALDTKEDEAPTGVAIAANIGSIIVTFDDPRTLTPPMLDWAYTEVHVDTTTGFNPDFTNRAARITSTRVEISGLIPGTTYFAKIRHYDTQGNVGATSGQVSIAAQRASVYHFNPDGMGRNLVPNGNFGQATFAIASNPPDGWTVTIGDWGTDLVEETTITREGSRAVKAPYVAGAATRMLSEFIPLAVDQLYRVEFSALSESVLGSTGSTIRVKLYDENKNALGFAATTWPFLQDDNVWETRSQYFYPRDTSTSVRFARIETLLGANVDATKEVYLDWVRLTTAANFGWVYRSTDLTVTFNTDTEIPFNATLEQHGNITIDGTAYGVRPDGTTFFRCLLPGTYNVRAFITIEDMAQSELIEIGVMLNGVATIVGEIKYIPAYGPGTRDRALQFAVSINLLKDDEVDVYIFHDHSLTRTVTGGSHTCQAIIGIDQGGL